MRKLITVFLFCTFCIILSAQETGNHLEKFHTIKKGMIILDNGTKVPYTRLSIRHDTAFYTNSEYEFTKLPLIQINQITRTKSGIGNDMLIGGGAGLISSALVSGIIHRDRTTSEWIIDKINDEDEGHTIKKEELPFIAIGTASGIAIGVLVNLLKSKEKVMYNKETTIDVFPELTLLPNQQQNIMLTIKINLKRN